MRARLGPFFWGLALLLGGVISACDCDGTGVGNFPEIDVSPTNIIYQAIPVGKESIKQALIRNKGQVPLTIREISVLNESGGKAFDIPEDKKLTLPLTLAPDETATLFLRYAPQSAGVARGDVRILSDAKNVDDDGYNHIKLASSLVSAELIANPNPLDFGEVPPGDTKILSTILSNKGQADLMVSGLEFVSNSAQELAIVSQITFPAKIEPGKDLEVQISYSPKGVRVDEILIAKNDTGRPNYEIRIVGQRAAPKIEVDPNLLTFTNLLGTKETKTFTIRNVGGQDLEVTALAMATGSSQDFSLLNPPSLPFTLKAQEEVKVDVEYHSQDIQDDQGAVEITSNDPDSPTVRVSLQAVAKGCDLKATPDKLLFTRPSNLTVTLSNVGNEPCNFKGASFSAQTSQEFSFFLPPPAAQALPPGKVLQLVVRFAPQDQTDDLGTLIVESDDADSPKLEIPLESKIAAGSECELSVTPSTIQYGFVGIGRAQTRQVTLENKGWGDCTVTQANLTVNPSQVFSLGTTLSAQGEKIPSGQFYKIDVIFTPKSGTSFQGELEITSTDSATPKQKVSLVGTTGQLCIEALPDPMDFGTIQQQCSSLKEALEIFNICNQTVQLTGIKFGAGTNQPVQEFFIRSSPNMPYSLAFGQSMQISLTYAPRNLGPDTGTLEVANSSPGQSPIIVSLVGKGVDTAEQTDTFQQLNKPEIDLLLVVDDSGSMSDKQTNLANNLGTFMNWAAQLNADYHIGVTTTDTTKANAGCLRGTPTFVTSATPNPTGTFANNVRVGTTGSATEKGLDASWQFFQSGKLSGCNQGFYRKDAALSLIYISDEEDNSAQSTTFYVNFLRNLKGVKDTSKIRASAIVGEPNRTCAAVFSAGVRYWDVATQLGGLKISLCDANWGNSLTQLGALTFGYRSQFFLSRPANPATIKVEVDGAPVAQNASSGWTYDAASNSINFASSAIPQAGQTIKVTYQALCLPP
ncbi:MAG: choice-of-anchor D domain-containing protein [Myxococcales bacterium]|nr:choice-of-anchor D domain-containing protein [Myxococcales bacterium]